MDLIKRFPRTVRKSSLLEELKKFVGFSTLDYEGWYISFRVATIVCTHLVYNNDHEGNVGALLVYNSERWSPGSEWTQPWNFSKSSNKTLLVKQSVAKPHQNSHFLSPEREKQSTTPNIEASRISRASKFYSVRPFGPLVVVRGKSFIPTAASLRHFPRGQGGPKHHSLQTRTISRRPRGHRA